MTQVVTWVLSGLTVGWLARWSAKVRRDSGLAGDLVTGVSGATMGGFLFAMLGIVAPQSAAGHLAAAVLGAAALVASRAVLSGMLHARPAVFAGEGVSMADLDAQVRRLGALERRVLASILNRRPVSRDPDHAFEGRLTCGERVADRVASFGGSWVFIGLFLTAMMIWMALNEEFARPFDPYPFILLNLVLSCVAALQAPIIMMSQNRQSATDRLAARNDYEVNLRAEMEIMALHHKLDSAREHEWAALAQLLAAQDARLARLEQLLGARSDEPGA